MKKILALLLAAVMVLALAACGGDTTPTTKPTEAPAVSKSFQFYGKFEESGEFASMLNVAFLLDMNEDGTAVVDKYAFGKYDASDVASNESYQQSYLSGTWAEKEKDGVPCLQIKLAYINADGTEANAQTCYAYDVAGTYTFDMTFPVVPGQAYVRTVTMEGKENKTYSDDNAFIQAYKCEFTAPEHIGTFVDAERNGTSYLQADGTLLVYAGYDKFAEGKWMKSGDEVTVSIGGEAVEVTMDGNKASFTVARSMDGVNTVDYTFVCEDVSTLAAAEITEATPYTCEITMGEANTTTAELVLNDDASASFKVFTDFAAFYQKIGPAVVLTVEGELEGFAAQIWPNVTHAYILNEDHSMTPIKNALVAGDLALLMLDDTNMRVIYTAYNMERDGFTYTLSEDGLNLTVTAPDAETLGAFSQVWAGVGAENWTVDGNTAAKAE